MTGAARRGQAVRIEVRVTPRSRRNEVVEVRDGVLVLRVSAPPVDGAATLAVRRLVADALGVPPSAVTVISGDTTRRKLLEVRGRSRTFLISRWPDLGV